MKVSFDCHESRDQPQSAVFPFGNVSERTFLTAASLVAMSNEKMSENCSTHHNFMSHPLLAKDTAPSKRSSLTPDKRKQTFTPEQYDDQANALKMPRIEEGTVVSLSDISTKSDLKVSELNKRVKQLFPDPRVLPLPCTSARLFASFCLISHNPPETSLDDTPRRSQRRQKQMALQPILPFLQSLVLVEVVSLEVEAGDGMPRPRPCRIAFSGFDCSSTRPPVDRIDGSGEHQSNSIRTLSLAKEALDVLISDKKSHVSIIRCLERLIHFLTQTLVDDASLQEICAASIAPSYPAERLRKPIQQYALELQRTLRRLREETSELLFIERHLNELLCRSIRYHLRLLFNPPPPRLTPSDVKYEERSKSFSKIHELISMASLDEKNNQWEVGGDRVAAIFNDALQQVCCFFGSRNLLDPSYQVQNNIDTAFCESEPAQRQIPKNNQIRLPPLSPEEVSELQSDVNYAFHILLANSAVNFLCNLLSIPKVTTEIKRLGGWADVETYAALLWRYELWESRPENEHYVLLSNLKTLQSRLTSIQKVLNTAADSAEVSLKDLRHRFRINATKKNKNALLRLYPEIGTVEELLQDGWKEVREFPTVSPLP